MKRDMDLVRDILLKIEELDEPAVSDLLKGGMAETDVHCLQYHLKMLVEEAGLVAGNSYPTLSDEVLWKNLRLTWPGHEYLNTIRDPEIWKKAKDGAEKVGGLSVELLGELAKGLVKQQIKKLTGVEI